MFYRSGVISPGLEGASREIESFVKRAVFLMIQNTPDVLKDEYPQKAYRAVYSNILGTIKNELTVMEFVPNVEVDDRTFILEYPPGSMCLTESWEYPTSVG